jgi:hypothetical protein
LLLTDFLRQEILKLAEQVPEIGAGDFYGTAINNKRHIDELIGDPTTPFRVK